jgi:hypothetical protein
MTTDPLRAAVRAMDHDRVNALIVELTFAGFRKLDVILAEEVAAAPHEVQEFWLGECNCDGHQN